MARYSWVQQVPLRSLLTRWCLAVLVVTQVGMAVGTYFLVDRFLWRRADQQLFSAVSSMWEHRPRFMGGPAPLPPKGKYFAPHPIQFSEWGPLFAQLVATTYPCVRLYDISGTRLFATNRDVPAPSTADLESLLHYGGVRESRFVDVRNQRWHLLLMPLDNRAELLGVLQVASSSEETDLQLRRIAQFIAVCSVVALTIGFLLLWWIAVKLSGPLQRLMQTTRQVGEGNLQARTGLPEGKNEVFGVSAAFDRMAGHLQSAFEAQRQFVADASHELKTPLTTLGGMTEVLALGQVSDEHRQALNTINREVARMGALVADLLTLSHAEERLEGRVDVVVLRDVLEELVDTASMLGPQKDLVCECPDDLKVRGPEDSVRRIFRNLIDNARHYTPPEGRITVRAQADGGRAVIAVEDTGMGISKEDLDHVFERFFRADRSRARKTGGTGLGLSIVQALVGALEGEVRMDSTLGQGTTVTVTLPLT
ncbi:MAG: sensor histidine kinase [Candidatus Xenobia bacterium]